MNPDLKAKLASVLKGAVIAGLGAVLTYGLDAVSLLPLGPYAPAVTAVLSVLVNIVRKVSA